MNTPNLTEKLKELILKCGLGQANGLRILDLEKTAFIRRLCSPK